MNSGPSATFGIMFSVTNSGSNSRLSSGDQQTSSASVTPTKAPSAKPPRISTAVTARMESHAYFADVNVATVASGEGSTNLGTWKASTRTCQSTITARCTIRMIAKDRAERIPSLDTGVVLRVSADPAYLGLVYLSTIWLINISTSLRGAKRRSNPASVRKEAGLLRGACHRARV